MGKLQQHKAIGSPINSLLAWFSIRESLSSLRGHTQRLHALSRHFKSNSRHFTGRGIYSSFAAAMEHIPKNRPIGYNTEAAAKMLSTWPIYQFKPSDYTLFFHLRPLLLPGFKLVDLGGGVGVTYHVLQQHVTLPDDFQWLVFDLSAVIEVGRQHAATQDCPSLRFTDRFLDAEGCKILICAGTLQYMEESLSGLLSSLQSLPSYILINRTPVWNHETFYTHQNIVDFTCVYRVLNRQQFIDEIVALGYRLVADWQCIESTFSVQFHPSTRLNAYHGFYFVRRDLNA